MPQDYPPITFKIGDSTVILEPGYVPNGYDTMSLQVQHQIHHVIDSVTKERGVQQQRDAGIEFGYFVWGALYGTFIFVLFTLAMSGYFKRIDETLRKKYIQIFFVSFFVLIPSIYNSIWPLTLSLFIVVFVSLIKLVKKAGPPPEDIIDNPSEQNDNSQERLQYIGRELNLSLPTVHNTLTKHWPYFSILNPFDKEKFTGRLQEFIAVKTFDIYNDKGLVEMPILISAAAIQLTFGLDEYLLEDFPQINIHPKEFIGVEPFVRVLEGNVSCGCINLSWKHFLDGIEDYGDGQNVGLHEMSHALYSQCFTERQAVDKSFRKTYEEFNACGNKVFETGKDKESLYSDYAYRNIQEFWAESIEIFFERPVEMRNKYGALYAAICDILNQDPANNITQLRTS